MIDIKLLLQDFDYVASALNKRQVDSSTLQELSTLASKLKLAKQSLESLQELQNKNSKLFGAQRAQGVESSALETLRKELESNKQAIAQAQEVVRALQEELESSLATIPNLPDSHTPSGKDESENVELERILTPREFDFTPKEHFELAEQNGWIDFAAGVKLAKSRFSVLRKEGALLSRALINFMIDSNRKAGFELVSTPVIVNSAMLFGTGQLPKFEEDMFKLASFEEPDSSAVESKGIKKKGHSLYLISTAEITLTNLYNDCIISANDLPICLTAQTPCFRKEAGSAGRDTRGIIREHQFDKVELVAITHPDSSDTMQERMLRTASKILSDLELPHRFMRLCSGDLGFSASNTIDIEVWLPGQGCYREISSVSNTRDFQARRAKIRYKENGKNHFAHTLNGSSLAVGRTLVAIMENHQQKDGTIAIPKVLESYL
ncbi:serine--tRNA ligase [Helicobacter canis]|uniref:Serine--tRNA ligase n=1 Tax=Helicobacter canis NCTC 12740 TaxID=1357399 RepID=V8CHR1_9HELI|nr:serine--tRNA ligase [Helicobacter canis]ETD26550.1 serine-tRNA ligase [Helicobacter canis NCTC 12740]